MVKGTDCIGSSYKSNYFIIISIINIPNFVFIDVDVIGVFSHSKLMMS